MTWALDIEEPTAFSTALLVLVVGSSQFEYVVSVAVSSTLVAGVFSLWRRRFYEQRGEYLYRSTKGDDHVLVPMRGAYRLRDRHPRRTPRRRSRRGQAGLLAVVGDEELASAERDLIDEGTMEAAASVTADGGAADAEREPRRPDDSGGDGTGGDVEDVPIDEDGATIADAFARDRAGESDPSLRERAESHVAREAAEGLEGCAARIEREIGVPCEVVVAGDDGAQSVIETARAENCDLIVASYETDGTDGDGVSEFVDGLLGCPIDTLVHRSDAGRTSGTGSWCPYEARARRRTP